MANITAINQTASNGDIVQDSWVNGVNAELDRLGGLITQLSSRVSSAEDAFIPFRSTPLSGLNLAYNGGSVKLPDGTIATLPPGTIGALDNTTSFLFVDENGLMLIADSGNRPILGFEVARITAAAGVITAIEHFPLAEVRPVLPDLKDYATVDYANTRSWFNAVTAHKNGVFPIPGTGQYYVVPFENIILGGGDTFNTAGVFTPATEGDFIFHMRIRVDTLAVFTQPNMAAKISLFVNNTEYVIAQGESARGDLVLNGSNASPVKMGLGDTATIKVNLTTGVQCRVRQESTLQGWRLPQ